MEIVYNGMMFRFQTPAEAIEWERLRERKPVAQVKKEYPKKRKSVYGRTYSQWTREEIFELLDAVKTGIGQTKIWRHTPISSTRHSRMGVGVMASRLKALTKGHKLPKDLRAEVMEWFNEYQRKDNLF